MTIWLEKLYRCSVVFIPNFSLAMSIAVFCWIRAPNRCKHKNLVSAYTVCCAMCAICISSIFSEYFSFFFLASLTVLVANCFGTMCDRLFERICAVTLVMHNIASNEFEKNVPKKKYLRIKFRDNNTKSKKKGNKQTTSIELIKLNCI